MLLRLKGRVVGATGSIGRACALMLSEQVTNIVLLGNPQHLPAAATVCAPCRVICWHMLKRVGERGKKAGWQVG